MVDRTYTGPVLGRRKREACEFCAVHDVVYALKGIDWSSVLAMQLREWAQGDGSPVCSPGGPLARA